MHVSHLSLTDFRSWRGLELALQPGPTTLGGANGQGKTNIVEALGYVATLGSHRVSTDAPLVRAGAERAVVRARIERAGRSTLVEVEVNPGRANRARVNRGAVPRAREVVGLLRTVLFAPEDLAIVRGDPAERRRFLDDLLVLRTPRLAGVRADYERVLKQRNALLKTALARRSGGGDMRTLDVWDAHLARTGSELLAARLALVEALRPHVATCYAEVAAGRGEAGVGYRSSLGDALPDPAVDPVPHMDPDRPAGRDLPTDRDLPTGRDLPTDRDLPAARDLLPDRDLLAGALLAELTRVRPQELERGVSLVGPHRDDMVLTLTTDGGSLPVRGYASHGESWSVALALRLASYHLLCADAGDDGEPVLVLDDVFAELDVGRRRRLAELVGGAGQVLVTAAVPDDVPAALLGTRYDILDGVLVRAG